MKLIFLLLALISVSCSASPIKDVMTSPASLNQKRLVINSDVGISTGSTISVNTYSSGTVSIRGLGDCGYYSGYSYSGRSFDIPMEDLPVNNFCLYRVELMDLLLDAPMTGQFLVRRFDNPDIKPLRLTTNRVTRLGVGWVQLAEDLGQKGIYEDREITLFPTSKLGTVFISGCGTSNLRYDFYDKFTFNIANIIKINKDCVLDILVNNTDFVKEGASVSISVYKEGGSFLGAPMVSNHRGRVCFTFMDPYVIRVRVNDFVAKDQEACVYPKSEYEVEAVTSVGRLFLGKFSDGRWVWVK